MKNKKQNFKNKNVTGSFLTSLLIAFFLMLNSLAGYSQCSPPASVTTINGVTAACPGQTKPFTITAVTGATSYTWTLPAGCSISGVNPFTGASTSVNVVFGATFTPPGNISVKANNACGSSAPTSKTISASYPSLSGISGTNKMCAGDNGTYRVTAITGVTFTWTVPSYATITSGQGTNSINVSFGVGFTSGTMIVAGSYGCGNGSARTLVITPNNPVVPSVITGSTEACPNTTHAYSIAPRAGETYNWTFPAGGSITGQGTSSVSITFPAGFTSGTVNVASQNGCGTSAYRNLSVFANPPVPGAISGIKNAVCNSTQTYTIAVVPTATSYTWTGTTGSTVTSGQGTNSASISFPASVSGYVQVSATNSCGTGTVSKLFVSGAISIKTHPSAVTVCQDDTSMISVDVPGSGLSYQWRKDYVSLTDNVDFSGTQTSILKVMQVDSLNDGYYDVIVSSNCAPSVTSSQARLTVNMKPPAPGPITKPDYACPGTSGVLTVPANGYNTTGNFWECLNSGTIISGGQGTNSVDVSFGTISQSGYSFRVRAQNGCGISHDTTTTWIRRSISVPAVYGPARVCPNQTNVNYTGQAVGQSTNVWYATPGITITSGQGTLSIMVSFSPTFTLGDIYLTASNPCMTAAPRKFHVAKNTGCRIGEDGESSAAAVSALELAAYPNPVHDKVNLTFNALSKNSFIITISDIYGKIVFKDQILAEAGNNKIPVELKNLNIGLYNVSLKSSDQLYHTKIMIEK